MTTYAAIRRIGTSNWGYVGDVFDVTPAIPEQKHYGRKLLITAGYTPAPVAGEKWWYDNDNDVFSNIDPTVPWPKRIIKAPELWLQIFTSTERAMTWAVCNGEAVPGVTITLENRYRTSAFRDLTLTGLEFSLNNTEVETVIDGLETAGVLASGRADEILER